MSLDKINEEIASYEKQLEDFTLQLDILNNQDDLSSEESVSKMNYILQKIEVITGEIEKLITQIE